VAVKNADADSEVLINGVRLGPQPTPLLHGDKIEISGQELLFVDDRRSGSTEYLKAVDPAMLGGPSKSKSKGGATAGTGGRLVSLTDGREYEISGGSVLIGRDAGCDIVISAKNVSRRHAEVVATPRGYVLIDNSTNGTVVNGEPVKGQHVLSRADVIRCGDHEFRFYADVARHRRSRTLSRLQRPRRRRSHKRLHRQRQTRPIPRRFRVRHPLRRLRRQLRPRVRNSDWRIRCTVSPPCRGPAHRRCSLVHRRQLRSLRRLTGNRRRNHAGRPVQSNGSRTLCMASPPCRDLGNRGSLRRSRQCRRLHLWARSNNCRTRCMVFPKKKLRIHHQPLPRHLEALRVRPLWQN
jgi:pSer/pThr/pTyr-binding forkhead associated (FHA) protein